MINVLNRFDEFVTNQFKGTKIEFNDYFNSIIDTSSVNDYNSNFELGFDFVQYGSIEEAYEDAISIPNPYESETLNRFKTYEEFQEFLYEETPTSKTSFKIMESLLTNVQEMVNLGGLLEKDKIKITADKNGIFDFSLASQGLYRPSEYYSQEFLDYLLVNKMTNPFIMAGLIDGVVPSDKVFKNKQNNEFEFNFLGNVFKCQQRQKGATNVLNNFSKECFLKETEKIFTTFDINNKNKIFNGKGKIRLKYASTNKKSYLIYSKKPESSKYVDFYLPQWFLQENVGHILTCMFPLLLTSAALEKFGIQSRISSMRVGGQDGNSNYDLWTTAIVVPVKEYDESVIDAFPKLLKLNSNYSITSDFYGDLKRLNQDKFYKKNLDTTKSRKFKDFSSGFDRIWYDYASYMYNILERYKNFLDQNPNLDSTKTISRNFFVSDSFRQRGFIRKTGNTSQQITEDDVFTYNLDFIIYKFFFYMDYIALEFNSIKDMVEEIQYRFENNKYFNAVFKVNDIDSTIRSYLLQLIKMKYIVVENFTPTGEPIAYADTKEEIERKDNTFQQKFDELGEILPNRQPVTFRQRL